MENNKQIIDCFDGDYAFLSNFYPSPIKGIDKFNIEYPTVEHAFQAMKTKDLSERLNIAAADTPGKAKRLGRKVSLVGDWEENKYSFMYAFVYMKFTNNPNLKEKLVKTGNAQLIEGNNWHDNYWGNCTCEKCKNIKGQNNLGNILMSIRDIIKDEMVLEEMGIDTSILKEPLDVSKAPRIILEDGTIVNRIPVGGPGDWFEKGNCTDCGAPQNSYHHEGCDCERCPVCGCQMLSCDCWSEYSV